MPRAGLARLVEDTEDFLETYWDRELWVGPCAEEPYDLVSLGALDHLLTQTALRCPTFVRMMRDGVAIDPSLYTCPVEMNGAQAGIEPVVDPAGVYEQFRMGATLVFHGLHRTWPALNGLQCELQHELGHQVQVNAYLTPPNSTGLRPHQDEHDVFVVQLHGSKQWQVRPPNRARRAPRIFERDEETTRELVLEPGSCMYLPRGWTHSAAAGSSPSLHLTVGITPVTWADVLHQLVDLAAGDVDELRASVPAGFVRDPDRVQQGADDAVAALARWGDAIRYEPLVAHLSQQAAAGVRPIEPGSLLQQLNVGAVNDTTRVALRAAQFCRFHDQPHGDTLLTFGGRGMQLPNGVAHLLRPLVDGHVATVGEWAPELAEDVRLALARELVRNGVLELDLASID